MKKKSKKSALINKNKLKPYYCSLSRNASKNRSSASELESFIKNEIEVEKEYKSQLH